MYILPFFSARAVSGCIRIPKAYHIKLILENLLLEEGREKNRGGTEKRNMIKNVMDILTEHGTNERLDALLMQDKEYAKLRRKINEKTADYDRLDLTKKQRRIIDRMISAYIESGAYHTAVSYRQGIKDGISMMVEAVSDQ